MVFTWLKVIFEISQEVETSSPEVENGIYLVTIEISQEWKRVPRKWNVVYPVEGNN